MLKRLLKFFGFYLLFRYFYQRRYRFMNWILENETLRLFLIHSLSKSRW